MDTLRSLGRIAAPAIALALTVTSASAHDQGGGPGGHLRGLKPGEFVTHELKVPLRIVLIGFEPGQVDEGALLAQLPPSYKPLVRYPQFYGLNGRDMGLEYDFAYRVVRKGPKFTKAFFDYLKAIGTEAPRTFYQTLYNEQASNTEEVTDTVLLIDAPRVEKWLDENDGPKDRGYTIYFVNWWGRDDFRFHVFTKTDEPDPDTGENFGQDFSFSKLISFGGARSRHWFYDFSAGPEWNTTNWLVDVKDLDGDGAEDYRMPPLWEYSTTGYRAPAALSGDMGLLTRYVAIDLLFTPSPLYDPLVTAPEPHGAKVAHISMFEDDPDPAQQGAAFISSSYARSKWRSFQPYYRWKVGLKDFENPIDAQVKHTYDVFTGNVAPDPTDCSNAFGTTFAQLFCFFDANLDAYVPPYGKRDYVGEIFAFNSTPEGLGGSLGLLGFADDNWLDGTQTYAFVFGGQFYRDGGNGFTATTIHEFGHHLGLSHPHDGYDATTGLDYGPGGPYYFAWAGDESDTVMHYITLSTGFGRHNRDNMYRWEAAGYLNWANALAGDILASPDAFKVKLALLLADHEALKAQAALKDWDYLEAVARARIVYSSLAQAAQSIGVTSASLRMARLALPGARPPKEGCRPRIPEEIQQRRQALRAQPLP